MIKGAPTGGKGAGVTISSEADIRVVGRAAGRALSATTPATALWLRVESFKEILRRGQGKLGRESYFGVHLFAFDGLIERFERTEIL